MTDDYDRSKGRANILLDAASGPRQWSEIVRRAFLEFLKVPSLVIVSFLLLALIMYMLDATRIAYAGATATATWGGLFSDAQATRDFLGVIAASIITVTSITLSLLLIAVQQGAASLTSLVFDQFLRRRSNQLYFGFFIGLALYALIVLASINPSHQPIYGVAVAGVMTVAALCMLILLIYTTINQMRPVVIIRSIHDHTLLGRRRQFDLLKRTRRAPQHSADVGVRVMANCSGFMTQIDVTALADAVADMDVEIVILGSVGSFVAYGDPIAELRMAAAHDVSSLEVLVRKAIAVEEQRDLDTDPAFGVEQLVTIGWTSISTAKSNPGPGLLAIQNLRDLLARWLQSDAAFGADAHDEKPEVAPVVYVDNLPGEIMKGLESLTAVASESMQHQSAAEIYRVFASLFQRLPGPLRERAVDVLMRSLSGLGDQMLTSDLDVALSELIEVLDAANQSQCADAMRAARDQLRLSVGRLHSRATRTPVDPQRHAPNL